MVKRIMGVFDDSDFLRLKSVKDEASKKAGHPLNWEEFIKKSVFDKNGGV